MPLVGIVDPDYRAKDREEPGRLPRWLTPDELLDRSLGATPGKSSWPYELVNSVLRENYRDPDHVFERVYVTLLTSPCPRGSVVGLKEPYIEEVSAFYAATRGTLVHRTMEYAARPGSIAEARFYTTVDDAELSCSPDLVTSDALWDYKTTQDPPAYSYPYPGDRFQVQFNRYVFNHAERWKVGDVEGGTLPFEPWSWRCEHLVLVYLGPKWPKAIEVASQQPWQFKNGKKGTRMQPDVWDDDRVLSVLRPRLRSMREAIDAYPEWPDGLEDEAGWAGPPDWRCPGPPVCYLPYCLARRHRLYWEKP